MLRDPKGMLRDPNSSGRLIMSLWHYFLDNKFESNNRQVTLALPKSANYFGKLMI